MGQAIGDLLPFALGVAISPIPIIAIIVMLLSSRAGANSASFLIGWIVGVTGASVALVAISGSLSPGSNGSPSTSSSVIKLVAGLLLVMLARRNFRKRPKEGQAAELPGWLAGIDSFTPPKAAGLGVLLSAANPKNLLLMAGDKAHNLLGSMKAWLGQNNATVMGVLLLVIGVVLVGKGIGGLSQ
jgi:hypothetical protein